VKRPKLPPRRPPQLLALVYLISIVLVVVTAVALSAVVADGIESTAVDASLVADRALVSAFVQSNVRPNEVATGTIDSDRLRDLEQVMRALSSTGIVRIKMYRPDGTVMLSNDDTVIGERFNLDDDLANAFAGRANGDLTDPNEEADLPRLGIPDLLEEYLPVGSPGNTVAVFEVYRDAAPILAQSSHTREQVMLVTLLASAVLAIFLYFVFRSADRRLKRQTRELMEATRRDALTGTLNHGAVVEDLTRLLDEAMPEERRLGIALVDVDNLGLLNDAHGHAAGDAILSEVATILREEAQPSTVIGRYGPDEFLLVAPPSCLHDLAPAVERLRYRLREFAPSFGKSERLPVSVSVGLCHFPDHGKSATELLSTVAVALSQAKMSGGDQVRWAESTVDQEAQAERASFDVLQGLVIAVDTKDRYTKRHSEDVARYALFLAKQLGLSADWMRTLHIAGMLHDIGKIGIPDAILRKPAPLTSDEYHIVKQHVALGHMIVRDLPNLDLVRAGIRFHHEQWNGQGYLERIEGDEIPLVARILAVADAMSAMTTSRTYRKALPLREALRRLEDAAGGQLDPDLVGPFVRGMETADDAPIPGDDRPISDLWTPAPSPTPAWELPLDEPEGSHPRARYGHGSGDRPQTVARIPSWLTSDAAWMTRPRASTQGARQESGRAIP
jgi:diguanylate cyclase (GGDEF)-like protein